MTAGNWRLRDRGARVAGDVGASILIVDDDPHKRLALKAALAPLALPIIEADSGRAALRCVMDQDFAVILLDIRMPEIDGFETAALIRRRRESEMTPIIFVTAYTDDEMDSKAKYVEGAVDFMSAPINPDELRAKVSVFVNLYLQAAAFASQARKVQASADQLRLLTDAAPIGIFRTDDHERFAYVNPRWTEITGISSEEALGRDWDAIIDARPPESSVTELVVDPVVSIEEGRHFEIQCPDSTVRLALQTTRPVSGTDDELVGWVGTLADVTVEAGAEEERARFRSLVQNSRDVISLIDESGGCSYVSPAIIEVGGYTPEEVVGTSGFEFLHPDDVEIVVRGLAEIVATPGGTKTVEVRTRTKAGGWIWIEIRAANRLDEPSIRGIVLNYHDITERRVAADRIAESESSLAEAQAISHIGSFSWNMTTDEWTWSDEEYWLFGYEPGSISPSLEAFMAAIHPEDRAWVARKRVACITKEASFDADFRVVLPDGSIRWIHGTAESTFEHGVAVRRVGIHQDITGRKEAELDHQNMELENERLEEQLRQGQKMEAVGRLAGGVAHDFNNILAVVLNYAEFVADTLGEDHEGQADLKQIIKAGERGAELVHQLLAFSRQEIIQPTVINLNDVIAGMTMLLGRSIGEEIDLDVETAPDLASTKADFGQLEQILMNLVVNAHDSMPDGGHIKIATSNVDLDIGARVGLSAGRYVCLTVTDTGRGIAPETLEHIFEPFFTTKARGEGTGLGLATVYGIVQQAQGGIYAESEVGVMTAFHIYLPVTYDELAGPTEHWDAEVVDRATILVVEDEAPVRELIGRILRREGFDVVDVGSGAEAVAICSEDDCSIDLLLTDVVMPNMSGPALRDIVQPLCPDMKVLFMSGYTDELIAKRGILDAGDPLLNKPFNSDQLLSRVRHILHPDGTLSTEIVEAAL